MSITQQQAVIQNYLFMIFDELGVSPRVELVLYCLQEEPAQAELVSEAQLSSFVVYLGWSSRRSVDKTLAPR